MATNEFQPFGLAPGPGYIMSPATWASNLKRQSGYGPGLLLKEELNTAIRQASSIAYAISRFIADNQSNPVNDDGDMATLELQFKTAVSNSLVTQALAVPGFISLPGGLILQWANGTTQTNEGAQAVALHHAFPTATLVAFASCNYPANNTGSNATYQVTSFTTSLVNVFCQNDTASWLSPVSPTVLAIGY